MSYCKSRAMLASAGDRYGWKMSQVIARLKKVLSTPNNTSASGLPLLRHALETISPASPALRNCTVALFSLSNCAMTSSLTAKLSWVMTTRLRVSGV